jgi:osmotically-inducible protein OsmY
MKKDLVPIVCSSKAPLAGMLLVVMLVAACATPMSKPAGQAQAEEVTADRVYSALNADPTYYFRHVDVRVDHGVAHLSGYVWSTDALYRAKQITARVPGVSGVVNEMELEREGGKGGGRSG